MANEDGEYQVAAIPIVIGYEAYVLGGAIIAAAGAEVARRQREHDVFLNEGQGDGSSDASNTPSNGDKDPDKDPNKTPKEILAPNGKPIGRDGDRVEVREMDGGAKGAKDLYDQLRKGGKPDTPSTYKGDGTRLPNGDWVGHRPTSRSGLPTVDVHVDGVPFDKIHFPD